MVAQLGRLLLLMALWPSLAFAGFPSATSDPIDHSRVAVFNVVTDWHAACTGGLVNDDAAFTAGSNAMKADSRVIAGYDVVIIIPPGATCLFGSCSAVYFNIPGNLTIFMTGASMTASGGSGCQPVRQGGMDFTNRGGDGGVGNVQPLIQTVSAGATCVTTVTASDAGFFTLGTWAGSPWVAIGALGLQGSGFPPNWGLFEYLDVVSANASTGQVCFASPLQFSYKSTWINNGPSGCSAAACGGNPRLFPFGPNATSTVVGGTWTWNNILELTSRNVVMNNVTHAGAGINTCYYPTLVQNEVFNNVTMTNCNVEVDKEVWSWIINGGAMSSLSFPSSSAVNTTLNNTSVISIGGSSAHLICNNSSIAGLTFGQAYGNPSSFAGTNCRFTNTINFNFDGGGCSGTGCGAKFIYTGGGNLQWGPTNNYPVGGPPQWYVPGTGMMFTNDFANPTGFMFTVGDSSCSGGGANTCFGGTGTVATSISYGGSLSPPVTANSDPTVAFTITKDPLRNWSCSNCTGSLQALELSAAPAQNQPLFVYSNRTYTCTANLPNVPNSDDINNSQLTPVLGNLTANGLTINVTTADTSAGANTLGFALMRVINQSTGTQSFYNGAGALQIDLKTTGLRKIAPTANTGFTGADVNPGPPGANSFFSGLSMSVSGSKDMTHTAAVQCPVVTVTWNLSR